jgi:transcriptional regulator with XRE-family HTH domain
MSFSLKVFAEHVRELRKEKGLTLKDLAAITGKNQQAISQFEKHEKSPTLATLCNLANALNADIKIIPRSTGEQL